jgi:Glycosyl transferase family 2
LQGDHTDVADLPSVSVLMPAYNAERFVAEAIESALEQDYPADKLELIVVDDGSTDSTAAIVARYVERHPGRVRLIRQPNAGNVAATNTALAAARGELLALLDSDDAWPRSKTRVQAALLAARPEVGLVYGDMRVIDADGRVLQDSWLVGDEPPSGRFRAAMLIGNSATASSIMMRASLGSAIAPIPDDMPFNDWWFKVRAAQVSEIAYLPEPRTLYRHHGANMGLGASGEDRLRELRKSVRFQRWFLRRLGSDAGPAADLLTAWRAFEGFAREALQLAGSPFAPLVDVTADDCLESRRLAAEAAARLARGDADAATARFLRAAGCDPWHAEAREGVVVAAAAADPRLPGQSPLDGAAPFVVRADARELLDDPSLLVAYADALAGVPGVTLAIDAADVPADTAAEALGALAADTGLADDDSVDLLAVLGPLDAVGRARLDCGTHATYGAEPLAADRVTAPSRGVASSYGLERPAFTPATLAGLRALVSAASVGAGR